MILKSRSSNIASLARIVERKSWQDKYRLLVLWGAEQNSQSDIRLDQNLVRACEAPVWLLCRKSENGVYEFEVDSDSRIVKGLMLLLISEVNGKTQEQAAVLSLPELLHEGGLSKHLSPSRTNGLQAVISKIIAFINTDC